MILFGIFSRILNVFFRLVIRITLDRSVDNYFIHAYFPCHEGCQEDSVGIMGTNFGGWITVRRMAVCCWSVEQKMTHRTAGYSGLLHTSVGYLDRWRTVGG
jgi:hypothetical protein